MKEKSKYERRKVNVGWGGGGWRRRRYHFQVRVDNAESEGSADPFHEHRLAFGISPDLLTKILHRNLETTEGGG